MAYYADPHQDLPAAWKTKRVVFYSSGLKVYGQIPYILQRKLGATFISNDASFMGGRIRAATSEDNYTVIPYRRKDGRLQQETVVTELLGWLYTDAGFSWAIAAPGEFERDDLLLPNWWNSPPPTYIPDPEQGAVKLRSCFLGEGK